MPPESSKVEKACTLGDKILKCLGTDQQFRSLLDGITRRQRVIPISGLTAAGAKALVLAAINRFLGSRLAYIVLDEELDSFADEVSFFSEVLGTTKPADQAVLTIPSLDVTPYKGVSPHQAALETRACSLYLLNRGYGQILLIPFKSLLSRTVKPNEIAALGLELATGREIAYEEVIEVLESAGYVSEDPVAAVGTYSVRGGIVDIYSPIEPKPVRVEFFGDQVESIRHFDPETQRSTSPVASALIAPMREFAFTKSCLQDWARNARGCWGESRFKYDLDRRIAFAEAGETFQGWEFLLPLVRPLTGSLFDYLQDAIFVIDQPAAISAEVQAFTEQMTNEHELALDDGRLALEPERYYLSESDLNTLLRQRQRLELHSLGRTTVIEDLAFGAGETGPDSSRRETASVLPGSKDIPSSMLDLDTALCCPEIELKAQSLRRLHGRLIEAIEDVRSAARAGKLPVAVMRSKGVAERFVEMLCDNGVSVELVSPTADTPVAQSNPVFSVEDKDHRNRGALPVILQQEQDSRDRNHESSGRLQLMPVQVALGKLRRGFELPGAGLYVICQSDIFDEKHLDTVPGEHIAKRRVRTSTVLSDFRDVKPGDYVVHLDHGIGQFHGLVQLQAYGEASHEFLLIGYAEGAKLYVPVERLDLVQKYASVDGTTPPLDKLGGSAWQRTKARAQRSMRDLADQLLKLSAERKLIEGFAFSPDTPWQQAFEAGFEYELTADQQAAIQDVKRDLEKPVPMDRLLCGDVGYGKTEVAMRAAFKVVMDGKQVAVLVPTTVLADQHYRTFIQRFAAFPVKVELLSRFRSPKEQKAIVQELEEGIVDIVIGTHRLLSNDVKLRDLGLVIVDEEQRFGVTHKEKLKQLKRRVDVVTMTATPIPRTLNMALMGIRDMSVIETPPRDRLAIQTIVAQFSPAVIKSAIERELDRGGQIFFVHNRVDSIYSVSELIRRLVPQARVAVTHGQMSERELEKTMMKFVRHHLDVLVTTAIIENGIDIPLANTMIINHAERFGLAELYQLRGRVGRSNRRAYAYLLIPPEDTLSHVARRRLAALKEFSDLGAGFRLAALDLELRGAGNLLGAEQSGQINAIGFELYCQLLDQTVRELRGEPIDEEVKTQINLGVEIRIPEDYVPDMGQRLRAYKRISSAKGEHKLVEIRDELRDRYGQLPPSVENLFLLSFLRNEAAAMGVLSIDRRRDRVFVMFGPEAKISPEKLAAFLYSRSGASLSSEGILSIPVPSRTDRKLVSELRTVLLNLREAA